MVHFQAVLLCELELNFTNLVMNDFARHKDSVSVWICKKVHLESMYTPNS